MDQYGFLISNNNKIEAEQWKACQQSKFILLNVFAEN